MKVYDGIDERLKGFIERQHLFFVATAPMLSAGHINISPRGLPGTFAVLDASTFAWLDTSGSGSETIAHLRDNGRITVMFCAFDGAPNIVRLHGAGRIVTPYDAGYDDLAGGFAETPGARAVIVVDVERVSDSCGWGVPLMEYVGERDLLGAFFERRGVEGSADYRRRKNRISIDGLPGYDFDPIDEWATLDGLAQIRQRMEALIDGWSAPATYGIAVDGEFGHLNQPGGMHGLPAVILATVLKHDGSTATLPITTDDLQQAFDTLAPAEACTEVPHPNLAAWRAALAAGGALEAVFVRDLADPVTSDSDVRLRALVAGVG